MALKRESATDSKDGPDKKERSTDGFEKQEHSTDAPKKEHTTDGPEEKERSTDGPEKKERSTNDPEKKERMEKEEPKVSKTKEEHLAHITEEFQRNHITKSREVDQTVRFAYPKTKLRMYEQDSNSVRVRENKSNRKHEGEPSNPLVGAGKGRQDKELLEKTKEKRRRKRGKCEKDPWAKGVGSKRQTMRSFAKEMGQIYEDYENYGDMYDYYSDYEDYGNDGDLDKDCNE